MWPRRGPRPKPGPVPTEPIRAPLQGLGVVVTRDEDEDGRLTAALQRRGAAVLHWPTIRQEPPEDMAPLRTALSDLSAYHWLVLTSRRATDAVAEGLAGLEGPATAAEGARRAPAREDQGLPPELRVAAVGRSTARSAEMRGWAAHLVPEPETGEALVSAMADAGVGARARILFPASDRARPTVPDGLRALGAAVDRVTAYRIVPAPLDAGACARALDSGRVRVITVTSPSSVENLRLAAGDTLFRRLALSVPFAAIGSTTAAAAREAGASEVLESSESSMESLAERVVEWTRAGDQGGAG